MPTIFAERENVTTKTVVFTTEEQETVITAMVACGVSQDCVINAYINNKKFLSDYPLPQKGIALSELEGQVLNSTDTVSIESDNPMNLRITAKYLQNSI